jgi:Family of unknown function (DUF6104)
MYFTDRGIEELDERRGAEQVSIGWLAERLREYVDEHPDAESTIDNLATWLARLDEDDEDGDLYDDPGTRADTPEPSSSGPESVE